MISVFGYALMVGLRYEDIPNYPERITNIFHLLKYVVRRVLNFHLEKVNSKDLQKTNVMSH